MKQTLRLNFQEGDLPSLHPHALMIYLRGLSIAKVLYEGLTRIDEQGKAALAGAKSLEISPDKLRYTFTLRSNCFSDGTPITARHYEQSWKEALSPYTNSPKADLLYALKNGAAAKWGDMPLDAVGVKAIDDKTLVVDLENPAPNFLELLVQPLFVPLKDPKCKEPSEFSGPYKVSQWKRESQLLLTPNPHFWDKASIGFKEIDICMVQDLNTSFSIYEKGEIDWIGVPLCPLTGEQVAHLKKQEKIKSQSIERMFWVFLNINHPALASRAIRQALSLSIDRKAIADHILIGGVPLTKPLTQGLSPLPLEQTLLRDLAKAKKLFSQGLKELNLTKDTFPSIEIAFGQQANRKQLAEYLQQTWKELFGIPVNLRQIDWNTLRSNLGKGLFEISGVFEAPYCKDPLELLIRFTSINPVNFSQWTYAPYTEKVSLAMQERDLNRRSKFVSEAEAILAEQVPFIPLTSDTILFSTTPTLKGYIFDSLGAIDFSRATKR